MKFDTGDDDNFTFVDFLPEVEEEGGFFTSTTYKTFRTVVDRANDFLRSNRKWEIVTCESVEFRSIDDFIMSNEMTYLELGKTTNEYVRGLRLWLAKREAEMENEQQIGYMNLIPEQLDKGGIFSTPEFETLDSVIERFNSRQRYSPVPGRIITIESQEMKNSTFRDLDPDRSNWSERGNTSKCFIFVLRIFYDKMAERSEEIGVKDFIPGQISRGGIFSSPKYEEFSTVVNQASTWLAQQQGLNFCNAQTLVIKQKSGKELTTQRTHFTEHGSRSTFYVRILRVAYTKSFIKPLSICEIPIPIRELSYKTFTPVQLVKGCCPEYEDLVVTKQRISAWVKATGAHVLSSETTAYRLRERAEKCSTFNLSEANEYWVFVIRLYIDGVYKEPLLELLPEVPVEKYCCLVS